MKKYKYRKTFSYNGKRYSVYANTLEELGVKKANRLHELESATGRTLTDINVRDWAEKCIDTYKTGQAEITRKKYMQRVEHCILVHIGSRRVRDITPIDCQQLLNIQKGKSKSHITKVYNALRFIFSHAVFNDIIQKDPTLSLQKPRGTYNPRRALTSLEREAVLDVGFRDRRFYCFLLMLLCGCRPQEACGCKGSDIYIVEGTPMLRIRGTKTKNAERSVPIPNNLYEAIKTTPKTQYIALYSNGNKITYNNRHRLWRTMWRELNLYAGTKTYRNQLLEPYIIPKDLTPYCLRHEYCSELARQGVDIRIAQKLMGHSDISLTANIYTHIDDQEILSSLGSTLGSTYHE